MSLTTIAPLIISQLDKSTSLYPILAKDMVDNCGRTAMAYKTGGKHEARERFIEEFGTSLFWIGGIPFFRKAFDALVFKPLKLDPKLDLRILPKFQKFAKSTTEQILKDTNLLNKQNLYIAANASKFLATTILPLYILVKALPRFNQGLTRELIVGQKQGNENKEPIKLDNSSQVTFASFIGQNRLDAKGSNNISFKGLGQLLNNTFNPVILSQKAQIDPVGNMLLLDYGISGGRLFNARNKDERTEIAVREAGIIAFFYYGADIIKAGLQKLSNKILNTPIDLDAKILRDSNFIEKIKKAVSGHQQEVLKFAESKTESGILKFIDQELKTGVIRDSQGKFTGLTNFTLELARKTGLLEIVESVGADGQKVLSRNSHRFTETGNIAKLNDTLHRFIKKAETNGPNVENFMKKAFKIKSVMVLSNLAVCSIALAYVLPKFQYLVRKERTGTNEFPGIRGYVEEVQKSQQNKPQPKFLGWLGFGK